MTETRAAYHAAHLTPDPARAVVWGAIADHLAPWVPADAHVLEVGAGYCDWINQVRASRRLAVDIWPEVGRFAAAGVTAQVLDASRDLRSIGLGTFDTVLASNVLDHFPPDPAAAVAADIAAVLKPGGRLIVIQPNFRYAYREYFDDYTHRAVFTDVSLAALLRASGFTIEHVQARFAPYTMQRRRIAPRRWLVRAYLRSPIKPGAGQMLVIARKD